MVVAVRGGQQKMWGAIERMSQETQELAQGDAGTEGEEDANLVPTSTNMDEGRPVPNATTSRAPQFIPLIMEPSHWFISRSSGGRRG